MVRDLAACHTNTSEKCPSLTTLRLFWEPLWTIERGSHSRLMRVWFLLSCQVGSTTWPCWLWALYCMLAARTMPIVWRLEGRLTKTGFRGGITPGCRLSSIPGTLFLESIPMRIYPYLPYHHLNISCLCLYLFVSVIIAPTLSKRNNKRS